jgi:hypothetical protein
MAPDSKKVDAWRFEYEETILMVAYNLSADDIKTRGALSCLNYP